MLLNLHVVWIILAIICIFDSIRIVVFMLSVLMSALRIAMVQMRVGKDRLANVKKAVGMIAAAAKNGSQLVILPECFNCPYGVQYFAEYADTIPGDIFIYLSGYNQHAPTQAYVRNGYRKQHWNTRCI